MSKFATEFPISNEMTYEKFCTSLVKWLSQSSNSKFKKSDFDREDFFKERNGSNSLKTDNDKESLTYIAINIENFAAISVEYTKHEKNISFTTSITFTEDKKSSDKWIGCQISNAAKTTHTSLPEIKKPKIINEILDSFGGGKLILTVQAKPHHLYEEDLNLVAGLINGDLDSRLPIIYISLTDKGDTALSVEQIGYLSDKLAGIAHIVVEPNRKFSRKLSELTNSKNAFRGYIGIYWAGGEGRNIIFNNRDYPNLCSEIEEVVTSSVSNRRPLEICSQNYIKERYISYQHKEREDYDSLLEEASNENKKYENEIMNLKDKINNLDEKLDMAEKEIQRLKQDLNASNQSLSQKNDQMDGIYLLCDEHNFYENEIKDILIEILKSSKNNHESMDRRKHIIEAVTSKNPQTYKGRDILQQIKQAVKNKSNLERHGFIIEKGKTHDKLYFKNEQGEKDNRYCMTLSKSSSDTRSGNNWVSDFAKIMGIPK